MHDVVAQAQTVIDVEQADLIIITVAMTRILILVMSLVVKLGTQYHLGLIVIQFLAKNIWNPQEIGETDKDVESVITTIPTHVVWKWIHSMYWL